MLFFWRTRSQLEVDFLLDDRIAIEVKAARRVSPADLKSLRAIAEELKLQKRLLVCHEPYPRETPDGIEILPVADFCQRLWEGELNNPQFLILQMAKVVGGLAPFCDGCSNVAIYADCANSEAA